MEERLLQLKQLKKEYKRLKSRAGWVWKCLAWFFWVLALILGIMTVFVLMNQTTVITWLDSTLWEPLKAAVKLKIDYAAGWRLTEQYGTVSTVCAALHGMLFTAFAISAQSETRKSDTYLNYRTLKLTLKAEKEEQ